MGRRKQRDAPPKRVDVMAEVSRHLRCGTWRFSLHANERVAEEGLTRYEIRQALAAGRRAEEHDEYSKTYGEWNYAIRGVTLDEVPLRVIVTFHSVDMVVVTAFVE